MAKYTQPPTGEPRGSRTPGQDDDEVGDGPRAQGPVHPALVIGRAPPRPPGAPWQQHGRPGAEGQEQSGPAPEVGRPASPARPSTGQHEDRKGEPGAGDRDRKTAPDAERRSQGAIAAADVLLYLIDLGERVQC